MYTAYKNDLEHRAPYIIGIISVLGFGIGMFDWNWLIFNLDVSMAAAGFILAGMILKDHLDELRKFDAWLFPLCLIIWMYLMKAFGYIEMSGRWYPELSLGVLESFCGSYCVIRFIQAVTFLKKPTALLTRLGRNSLWLMCIHAVEDSVFSFWMNMNPTLAVALRLSADVILLLLLTQVGSLIGKKRMEN